MTHPAALPFPTRTSDGVSFVDHVGCTWTIAELLCDETSLTASARCLAVSGATGTRLLFGVPVGWQDFTAEALVALVALFRED